MPGSDLNLTCVAVGSPMPYVSWRKGNIELNKENIPIGKNVLTLTDIQESENYTCVASSKHGTIETRTEVVVQSLPRPPNRIKATDVTPSSLKLAWMYENAPAAAENVIYFIVQYRPKGATNFEEKSSITTTYYLFESLLPYTDYEFRVLAANTIGRGEPSESFFITTGDLNASSGVSGGKKASSHPRNVLVRPLSTTVVVVQWEQPEEPNGQVIGYKVYYTKDATRPITEWDVQSVDSTELTTISDLATNVLYTLRVQAVTTRGMGSFSPPVQVRTQQGVPSQPQNLITTHVTATTVRLVWDKPDNTGEAIIGYDIGWNDTFTNEEFKRSIPEVETYTVGELYPDTLYYIWVTAKSRRGHGAATPAIPVKTAPFSKCFTLGFALVFLFFCFRFLLFFSFLVCMLCPCACLSPRVSPPHNLNRTEGTAALTARLCQQHARHCGGVGATTVPSDRWSDYALPSAIVRNLLRHGGARVEGTDHGAAL